MITLTSEQAQQIEEALEDIVRVFKFETGTPVEALATIRAAKAQEQAEQEPVAWMCWIDSDEEMNPANAQLTSYEPKAYAKRKPLYAASQPVKQEPVAEIIGFERTNDIRGVKRIPRIKWNVPLWEDESPLQLGNLYAAPVRTKDLTDDEIEAAVLSVNTTMEAWITYRAVIAADREKNK